MQEGGRCGPVLLVLVPERKIGAACNRQDDLPPARRRSEDEVRDRGLVSGEAAITMVGGDVQLVLAPRPDGVPLERGKREKKGWVRRKRKVQVSNRLTSLY